MNRFDFLFYLSLLLYFIAFISQVVSYFIFKRNQDKYDSLLRDFRQRGLRLDLITDIASFLGPMFNAHKIAYFVSLYRGQKIILDKKKPANDESCAFIRSQPMERVGWLLSLHKLNVASFAVLFLAVALSLINHSLQG
ncbi:hypothetical protein [Pantoea sp. At-9b]|uniref:hypothetical protein n=1 Tax=Pantoea sp. (strain At-9b) TaxID=592316 RepID=UPI0001B4075D|nr:hypothetical protein [Pantoea sp. At-9b]ADU69815.1 conserved hypothetical protein [Pantoea sp. At-9b]